MAKKIGSYKNVDPEHKKRIIEEAVRLNGSVRSLRGFAKLRRFAEKKCGILIDDLVLRHILRQPPQRRKRSLGIHPPIRHSHAIVGVV